MLHRIFLSITLLFGLSQGAQAANEMLDLPVNPETTALTYLYCVTDDTAATTDLLKQRYRYIGETEKNARRHARHWVNNGYCATFLSTIETTAPQIRERVAVLFDTGGFTMESPISDQVSDGGKPAAIKVGEILKRIGDAIKGFLGIEDKGGYMVDIPASGSNPGVKSSCDSSVVIIINTSGGGFEPAPFFPTGDT